MARGLIFIFRISRAFLGSVTITASRSHFWIYQRQGRQKALPTLLDWGRKALSRGLGVLSSPWLCSNSECWPFESSRDFSECPLHFSMLHFSLWRIYWFFFWCPFPVGFNFSFFSGWHFCKFIIWSCICLASELKTHSLGPLGESSSCLFLHNYSMTFTWKVYCSCFANTTSH